MAGNPCGAAMAHFSAATDARPGHGDQSLLGGIYQLLGDGLGEKLEAGHAILVELPQALVINNGEGG